MINFYRDISSYLVPLKSLQGLLMHWCSSSWLLEQHLQSVPSRDKACFPQKVQYWHERTTTLRKTGKIKYKKPYTHPPPNNSSLDIILQLRRDGVTSPEMEDNCSFSAGLYLQMVLLCRKHCDPYFTIPPPGGIQDAVQDIN